MKQKIVEIIFITFILTGCADQEIRRDYSYQATVPTAASSTAPSNSVKETDGTYILDQNGCKHFNPNPKPNETATWSGKCVNGYGSGYGTFQWYKDGKEGSSKYIGEMKNGKEHGKGVLIFANGEKYKGSFVDGKKHGKGTFNYANGDQYSGQWKGGEKLGDTKFEAKAKHQNAKKAKEKSQKEAARYKKTNNCQHLYVGKRFTNTSVGELLSLGMVKNYYIVESISKSKKVATFRGEKGTWRFTRPCHQIPE